MRSFKYTLSIFTLLFIVSCAKEESSVSNETGPIYKGPFYNEFLACDAGPVSYTHLTLPTKRIV